jgi:hypothetical protein
MFMFNDGIIQLLTLRRLAVRGSARCGTGSLRHLSNEGGVH